MEKSTQIVVVVPVDVTYDTDKATFNDVRDIVSRRASDLNAQTIEQSVRINNVNAHINNGSTRIHEEDVVVCDDERKLIFVTGERFEFVSNPRGIGTCERCAFDKKPCNHIPCIDVAEEWGFDHAFLVRTNRKE